MSQYSRREVLKLGALLAAGLGLDSTYSAVFADGLQKISTGEAKVLWLQGMSCSGCSVSFLNSTEPGAAEIITSMISPGLPLDALRRPGNGRHAGHRRSDRKQRLHPGAGRSHSRRNARGLHDGRPHAGGHPGAGAEERESNRGRRHLRLVRRHSGRRGKPNRRRRLEDVHGAKRDQSPEPSGQLPELPGPSGEHLGHVGLRGRRRAIRKSIPSC